MLWPAYEQFHLSDLWISPEFLASWPPDYLVNTLLTQSLTFGGHYLFTFNPKHLTWMTLSEVTSLKVFFFL